MIELAVIPGARGSDATFAMTGLLELIPSTAVGISSRSSGGSLSWLEMSCHLLLIFMIRLAGELTTALVSFRTQSSVRKLPRWGVEMKTTRLTKGR